jgi:uncharacterized membrane protein
MQALKMHLAKCFVAGIVAILPLVGLVLTVVYFEHQVAGVWLKDQGFYVFGLGLILLALILYLIGLMVSSLIGRWLFGRFDQFLDRLPVSGMLYQTLKQMVGYGEGPQGLFKRVVWVPFQFPTRTELGLVTMEPTPSSAGRVAVFLPAAPTPTTGRLIYLEPNELIESSLSVREALQLLVSLGGIPPAKSLHETPASQGGSIS